MHSNVLHRAAPGPQSPAQQAPGIKAPTPEGWRAWQGAFSGPLLTAAQAQALNAAARRRAVAAGAWVFLRGETARGLVWLQTGSVALGIRGADGLLHTERVVQAPGWCDLASAWLSSDRSGGLSGCHGLDAQAQGPAGLVELDPLRLRAAFDKQPALAGCFIEALAREVHTLSVQTHALLHQDAPSRFAAWLLHRLGPDGSPGPHRLDLGERKRDIASQLAITPETLSRLIRSFTRRGVISVTGYTVLVLDRAALRDLAGVS